MKHGQSRADSLEPFWWGLFAAGGMVAALLAPAHILLQNVLGPLGVPVATARYGRAHALSAHPLVRVYLFVLTALPLFHWAHRFRYYLLDFGIMGARRPIAMLCYGSAIAGTISAARTLLRRQTE